MTVRMLTFFRAIFAIALTAFAAQVFAVGVNFAGNTATAAAAVAMNGGGSHVSDSGQVRPILVSTQTKYPPIGYKPQVFQREFSKLQGRNLRAKGNQAILEHIAKMYIATQEFNRKNNGRELKIDVLTVEAIGGKKGFARSKAYATEIAESLKKFGVQNVSLDPEPRDPIPLPPGLTDQQPRGKT
jgi:hypothetical protein